MKYAAVHLKQPETISSFLGKKSKQILDLWKIFTQQTFMSTYKLGFPLWLSW